MKKKRDERQVASAIARATKRQRDRELCEEEVLVLVSQAVRVYVRELALKRASEHERRERARARATSET